jgi:hypothetical protein
VYIEEMALVNPGDAAPQRSPCKYGYGWNKVSTCLSFHGPWLRRILNGPYCETKSQQEILAKIFSLNAITLFEAGLHKPKAASISIRQFNC